MIQLESFVHSIILELKTGLL